MTEGNLLGKEQGQPLMMAEYIYNALAKARYQVLEDGSYYGDIFLCPGVWATGDTVEECRDALADVLADCARCPKELLRQGQNARKKIAAYSVEAAVEGTLDAVRYVNTRCRR